MILFSRLPGQEDGNVVHVVSEGAGEWAPTPKRICSVLSRWLNDPEQLANAAHNSHRLSNPRAAREIAHLLAAQTGIVPQAALTRSHNSQN
jgi:1,2-diacylglycerol 3-beta-galactosyltransferase